MEYEKRKKFVINFLYALLITSIIYIVLQYGLGLVTPFLFAFVIAYILKRPAKYIAGKLKIPYKPIAFILLILFYCTIGVLISLGVIKVFSVATEIMIDLPNKYGSSIEPFLTSIFENVEKTAFQMDSTLVTALDQFFGQFIQSIGEMVSNFSVKAVGAVSSYASSLPGMFIQLILMVISSFFIIGDYDAMTGFVLRQFSGKGKELIIRIKEYILGTLFVCIRSYALIMCITFVELSIGLSFIGIPNSIVVAFSISIFDVLPILGTGGIMIPWIIISAFQGHYIQAFSLLVLYLVITVIRNIVEPKIVGKQIGLHPVVTLVSMFVGAQLFGVIGLFGFPITLSLLCHLNSTGTIKMFK